MIRTLRYAVIIVLILAIGACTRTDEVVPSAVYPTVPGYQTIAYADLPAEAKATLELITKGGPYPYRQDGTVFANRERLLPQQQRGYYLEFTVPTPGEKDRGARRIIAGSDGERFYTQDHYRTFLLITG